jgi:hypothetical protein
VKTKSIFGEPGVANSSHDFERAKGVSSFRFFRSSMANGWTSPLGWDPAENALKRSPPSLPRMASARIERAEFPVQRNRTL